MNSWQILRTLFNVRDAAESPLYYFERARPPRWWSTADHLLTDSPRLVLILSAVSCYLCSVLGQHIGPLVLLIALLPFAGVIFISLNIASVVAHEREHHTWDLLRTAPLPIETLLLSRAAGRLWWLRDSLRGFFGLLVVIALFLSCASTALLPDRPDEVCWGTLALAILSMVFILVDRIQQFVLIVVTALAAGSSSTSARMALTVSASSTFVIWLIDLMAAVLVISQAKIDLYLFAEQVLLASLFGPVATYIISLPASQSLPYAALTLIVREILVYAFWRYTVWAACTI